MLNVSNELKNIYKNDRLPYSSTMSEKDIIIYFPEISLTLTSENIPQESFSLEENLCESTEYLKFGSCLSNCVKFSLIGTYTELKGKKFTITQIVNSLLELDNIERVQFLIDGEKAESLMGHIDISEPFESIED